MAFPRRLIHYCESWQKAIKWNSGAADSHIFQKSQSKGKQLHAGDPFQKLPRPIPCVFLGGVEGSGGGACKVS